MGFNISWRRSGAIVGGICLTGLLGTACSDVQSIDLKLTKEDARKDAYLNYSVAKSLFTIQITAASATTKAPASAASPAPSTGSSTGGTNSGTASSPGGTSPGGTSTTWNISGTVTQGGKKTDSSSGGDQSQTATDSTLCGVLTAKYSAAQTAVAAEIAKYGGLQIRLAQMAGSNAAKGDTPGSLAGELDKYLAAIGDRKYVTLVNETGPRLYEFLVAHCPTKVTVAIQQTVVPDSTRTFALKPQTNIFYSDNLALGTDANGFLTNGAPTSASQVTAIASAIANTAGLGLGLSVKPPIPSAVTLSEHIAKSAKKPPCPTGTVTDLQKQIAALACSTDADAANMAEQIMADLTPPGSLSNLPAAALPLTIYARVEDLEKTPARDPNADPAVEEQLRDIKANFGVDIALSCSPRQRERMLADTPENEAATGDGEPRSGGLYDGLVVSGSRACLFTATQTVSTATQIPADGSASGQPARTIPIARNYLWAQDSRYLVVLPTARGFLVARSVAYTFSNGQATGVTDSRPSEALAFVSFPGTVIGSFFSGVTSGFSNSNAFTNGAASDVTAQTNYLTAQANYLAAQANLKKAQGGN